jgi:flavin reductase (DIM6/NTAB) family NADH-FMN oxidoreductase RutF
MGRFATGVTVVNTRVGEIASAMTPNAILSLSLDPPLILISVQKGSQMHGLLRRSDCFAANILRASQQHLSRRFAKQGPKDMTALETTEASTGAPILVDALAFADCRIRQVIAGGDHDIFIGEMLAGQASEGDPLLFYSGNYSQLPGEGRE